MKQSTKDRILSETPDEVKQRVRDRADLLVRKQETLEKASLLSRPIHLIWDEGERYDCNKEFREEFKKGAKWQKNDCVQFINKLEDESFDGWSEEEISAYLTACMTIKKKYIDTLNGN